MRIVRYEICADEAWTHASLPLNRYWCFFGGILGSVPACDRLESKLRRVATARHHKGEIKWSSVTDFNIDCYKELVDVFFEQLRDSDLRYRQTFLDRSYVAPLDPTSPPLSLLDVQFRVCYQFLKHHFGLKYLPEDSATRYEVMIRLDNHSSQGHKDELKKFAERLGTQLGRPNLVTTVQFVDSRRLLRLQLCDLLMGAAGSHGNKMHLRRESGRRGMSVKQKARYEMAGYIYDHLRKLDQLQRNTQAFNWFESTGIDDNLKNRFSHKLRIWKFIPNQSHRDEGWFNKNLDSQGRYRGPIIVQKTDSQ